MAITNLTNTSWLINEIPNTGSYKEYTVNTVWVNSSGTSCTGKKIYIGVDNTEYDGMIRLVDPLLLTPYYKFAGETAVWQGSRIIKFTSGTDIKNTALISWLESNATLLKLSTPSISLEDNLLTVTNIDSNTSYISLKRNNTAYKTLYCINGSYTNISAEEHDTLIESNGTVEILLSADEDYKLPDSAPTVTGAESTYRKDSDTEGSLTISNPTSTVSFSIQGEELDNIVVPAGHALILYKADNPWPYTASDMEVSIYRSSYSYVDTKPTPCCEHTIICPENEVISGYQIIKISDLLSASGSMLMVRTGSWYDVSSNLNGFHIGYIFEDGTKKFTQADIETMKSGVGKTVPSTTEFNPASKTWMPFRTNCSFYGYSHTMTENTVMVIILDYYSED